METPQIQAKLQALAGVQVLELGSLIAGPYAAALLAQSGAEVIKIEPPASDDSPGGDPLRTWRKLQAGTSLWWYSQSRNKKSVALDLKTTEARDIVRKLVATTDILIENFRPGTRSITYSACSMPPRYRPGAYTAADIAADIAADPHYAALGEHTERVLASIGIDRAGYGRLRDRGIV